MVDEHILRYELVLVFEDADLTPNSTGTPAFPLLIHSVCGSKIENNSSSCGIVCGICCH